MKTEEKYSLWLMPTGKIFDRLQTLIHQLSEQYNTPRFEPHITLIGGLVGAEENILAKTAQCVALVNPFRIRLTTISYRDEYFRCLFIRATETEKIIQARVRACSIFDHPEKHDYMPHLSLMYGDLPSKTKKEIIIQTGKEFCVTFNVGDITLFSTAGEPKDWYRIKTFSLE